MDFIALAQECAPQVAHETLAAIVKTESDFRPLSIGINGEARLTRQPTTKDEAVVTAQWLLANGYNIDMGLGQINSNNLSKLGLSVEEAFDPCKNLAAAATILSENYQTARQTEHDKQTALRAALSAYNTGSFTRGLSNGYVQKVVNNARTASASPVVPPISLTEMPTPRTTQPPTFEPARKQTEQPVKLQAQATSTTTVYGNRHPDQGAMVYANQEVANFSPNHQHYKYRVFNKQQNDFSK